MKDAEFQLWQRIKNFEHDDPDAEYPFSARLARENNWPLEFALKAVHEYKKFMFLQAVSPTPLTPPQVVDEVWHLHLIYTKSYWDEFCNIIGRPMHHNPTAGGKKEAEKFTGWFSQTRTLYKEYFNNEPPADIWGPAKKQARKNKLTFLKKLWKN